MVRIGFLVFGAIALAGVAGADGKKGGTKHPEGYAWETVYETAKTKAQADGKLMFIDFYTDW